MARQVAWLVDFVGRDAGKFWSGRGDLLFEGATYFGAGQIVEVEPFENAAGQQSRRNSAKLFFGDSPEVRRALLNDEGPLPIQVRYITSDDDGATWAILPLTFNGQLSSPTFDDAGVYSVEIETHTGDIDRGSVVYWSDEDQQRLYGDRGFAFARDYQQGVEILWPS